MPIKDKVEYIIRSPRGAVVMTSDNLDVIKRWASNSPINHISNGNNQIIKQVTSVTEEVICSIKDL